MNEIIGIMRLLIGLHSKWILLIGGSELCNIVSLYFMGKYFVERAGKRRITSEGKLSLNMIFYASVAFLSIFVVYLIAKCPPLG